MCARVCVRTCVCKSHIYIYSVLNVNIVDGVYTMCLHISTYMHTSVCSCVLVVWLRVPWCGC